MGRPKVPLLSQQRVVDAALRIIDQRGLKALNMRALGAELGVDSSSLYHHFKNREAVERAVLERVLGVAQVPEPDLDWRVALRNAAYSYRAALLRHPNAAPLLFTAARDRSRTSDYPGAILSATSREGLPPEVVAATVTAVWDLAVGSALRICDGAQDPWSEMLDDDAAFSASVKLLIENLVVPDPDASRTRLARRRPEHRAEQPKPRR